MTIKTFISTAMVVTADQAALVAANICTAEVNNSVSEAKQGNYIGWQMAVTIKDALLNNLLAGSLDPKPLFIGYNISNDSSESNGPEYETFKETEAIMAAITERGRPDTATFERESLWRWINRYTDPDMGCYFAVTDFLDEIDSLNVKQEERKYVEELERQQREAWDLVHEMQDKVIERVHKSVSKPLPYKNLPQVIKVNEVFIPMCPELKPAPAEPAPAEPALPGYLDPNHKRYAPKLAAAVQAWLNYQPKPRISTKQSLSNWLTDNAVELGLTAKGKNYPLGKNSISEIAALANWDLQGGAPKTPTS
ncbi:hypothetical protein ACTG16_12060 [Aeromonas sp. 23P]|uniref:hypothetical protein n=1 Tax=unclassified Aeromonas TaxID=257493 RepID=UPI003F7AD598